MMSLFSVHVISVVMSSVIRLHCEVGQPIKLCIVLFACEPVEFILS